jgi:hypothetical protein
VSALADFAQLVESVAMILVGIVVVALVAVATVWHRMAYGEIRAQASRPPSPRAIEAEDFSRWEAELRR